ncbi:basal body protein [Volvox carteri f. nagariensis]|uniref:Basal body protein n=1 Tax=Volvox carteri f. nagariensis TaxID=3068 RepID=D8TPR8_VOLCA|nr:basal body protein [Volvox carteri f. nagariensis]EFJ50664.1 basal body protein [Volvox carteri f. nagariensis]|eukprot:XP_002948257.1 basal body protein [Volvox carteri f. nagariensis]
MDDRQLAVLRRKLDALGYSELLDPSSAPLVQKLVEDLVHTTDSYRLIKQQCSKQAQEMAAFDTRLEAVRQESVRLQSENSQLHVLVMQHAERHEKQAREHYQACKRLEDTIAELSYWKHCATEKLQAAERENSGLRKRCADLIKLTDKLATGAATSQLVSPKITSPGPIRATPPPSPPHPRQATVDVLQAANSRILSLQRQLADTTSELEALRQRAADDEDQIRRRDVEISRLGSCVGADTEMLALRARNDANESMILQLNGTIDSMGARVQQLEGLEAKCSQLEGALRQAEAAREEAEARHRRSVQEHETLSREVGALRRELLVLQDSSDRAAELLAEGAMDAEGTPASVLVVRKRLADAKSEQERLSGQLAAVEEERIALAQQVTLLRAELEDCQFLLTETRAHAGQAAAQQADEADRLAGELAARSAALRDAEARLAQVSLSDLLARLFRGARCEDLCSRLEATERSAAAERSAALSSQRAVSRLESELRVARSGLSALEQEAAALRQKLQDVSVGSVRAASALSSTEDEASRARQQAESLSQELAEERRACEELRATRDQLQLELERVVAQSDVLQQKCTMLQEQLSSARQQLAAAEARVSGAARDLSGMGPLQQRCEELSEQARRAVAEAAEAEAEAAKLRAQAEVAAEATARSERAVWEARREANVAREEEARMRGQLREAEAAVEAATKALRVAEAARDRALAESRLNASDLASLRDQLAVEASSAEEAGSTVRQMAARLTAAEREAAARQEECERAAAAVSQAEAAAAAARGREEEARVQGREWAERARRAEAMVAELEADVAQLRSGRQTDSAALRSLEEALAASRRDNDSLRSQVDQLTTLGLRGDATVQEFMANLKAMSADLRAAEMRNADLAGELAARQDELAAWRGEAEQLRGLLRSLDGDRDALQSELDSKAEQLAVLQQQLEEAQRQAEEAARLLALAEGRLAHTDARTREAEAELESLRQQLAAEQEAVRSLGGERQALRDELRAVHEDLEMLVRENQVVSAELANVVGQRDTAVKESQRQSARAVGAEQLLRAKEAEAEDLRRVYEALAGEHRRQSGYSALEREGAMREAALQAKASEVSSLAEAQRAAQATINQYVMDQQAYERQIDNLSRQLSQVEAEGEELARQREAILEELRAAQQVRLGVERHREELQRQVAALDSQVAIGRARLDDAAAEAANLNQRLVMERNRRGRAGARGHAAGPPQLEGLLASMRAREFRVELASDRSGGQLAVLGERNKALEQQVSSLQHQVGALQASRDAQDRELARLRAEALALAAAATPAEASGVVAAGILNKDQAAVFARVSAERDAALQEVSRLRAVGASKVGGGADGEAASDVSSLVMAAVAAASSTGAPGSSSATSALHHRVSELERRNSDLLQELRTLQDTCRQQESLLAAANNEVTALQSEHRRLVELVARLDQEKVQLTTEVRMRARQGGIEGGLCRRQARIEQEATNNISRAQGQLKEEQVRRRQAERDFLELLSSIEGADGEGAAAAVAAQHGENVAAVARRRLQELQAQVDALEGEKASLEEATGRARVTLAAMSAQMAGIQADYDSTNAALSSITALAAAAAAGTGRSEAGAAAATPHRTQMLQAGQLQRSTAGGGAAAWGPGGGSGMSVGGFVAVGSIGGGPISLGGVGVASGGGAGTGGGALPAHGQRR